MLANREVFAHLPAAAAALLTGATGIDFHELRPSFFGFAAQDVQEAGPAGVTDRAGQPAVRQHPFDVERFDSDETEREDQATGDGVVVLASQVLDAGVNLLKAADGLAAVLATLLLAGDGAAGDAQLRQGGLEVARVGLALSLAGGEEGFQPHVDTDRRQGGRLHAQVPQVARRDDKPLVRLALERQRLDRAFHGPMQLDADRADVLDAQAVAGQTDAVAVAGVLDAIEAVAPLEPRIARPRGFLLDPAEEVRKRLVQAPHRGLGGREVEAGEEGIRPPLALEPCRLFRVLHRALSGFVGRFPLVQASVVQSAVRLQSGSQLALLIGVGEQAVLEGAAHLLPLLVGDVALDGGFADGPDRAAVVRAAPQGRETGGAAWRIPAAARARCNP